jgi:WD40 repeat protein
MWNVSTGNLTATFKDPNNQGLYAVAFSPDGRLLAVSDTTGSQGVVYLWNVSSGHLVNTLQYLDAQFADLAFSPNGRVVAVGDTNGNVELWQVANGQFIQALSDPLGKGIIGIAFSPGGDLLASTDTAGDAYVWSTKWLG